MVDQYNENKLYETQQISALYSQCIKDSETKGIVFTSANVAPRSNHMVKHKNMHNSWIVSILSTTTLYFW